MSSAGAWLASSRAVLFYFTQGPGIDSGDQPARKVMMKRFWEAALAVPRLEGGYGVVLDGRPLRLPGGGILSSKNHPLAQAIAEEWQKAGGTKGGEFHQDDVPLTRLLGAAQERITPDPQPVIEGIAKFGETDLLCYRAEDRILAARQAEAWQPLLEWSALALDAPLCVTNGLMPIAQPAESLAALRLAVARHDAAVLAALGVAVPALGSLVLGLALSLGRLDAREAHQLAILDELSQEEFWGADAEAEAKRQSRYEDVKLAQKFLTLIASQTPARDSIA